MWPFYCISFDLKSVAIRFLNVFLAFYTRIIHLRLGTLLFLTHTKTLKWQCSVNEPFWSLHLAPSTSPPSIRNPLSPFTKLIVYRLSPITKLIVYRLSPIIKLIVYRLSPITRLIAYRLSSITKLIIYRLSSIANLIIYRLSSITNLIVYRLSTGLSIH